MLKMGEVVVKTGHGSVGTRSLERGDVMGADPLFGQAKAVGAADCVTSSDASSPPPYAQHLGRSRLTPSLH